MTAAEFGVFLGEFDYSSQHTLQQVKQRVDTFFQSQPRRAFQGHQNENVSGDQIFRSKDLVECFDVQESRDLFHCHRVYNGPNSDCADVNEYGMNIQCIYEGLAIGINAHTVIARMFANEQVSNIAHSIHVHHAHDILGCVSVKRGEYCILNKQYSKQDYTRLREKIVAHMRETGEWGQFFPIEYSPFGYNETVAQEYFPLSREQALRNGYSWYEQADRAVTEKSSTDEYSLPDSVRLTTDQILTTVLRCEASGRPYKIQKHELEFYRKHGLALPRLCYHQRHQDRFKRRNPRQLFVRQCSDCGASLQTSFSSERTERILCESCYEKVVA